MKYDVLKRLCMAGFAGIGIVLLAAPGARAGSLLDQMQVPDTCSTTYAKK